MNEESTNEAVTTQANIAETTDWRASLPEDIRGAKAFDSVKDVASLGKQFLDAQSHIGNSIRIPGEDAGQEAIDAFHQKVMNKTNLMIKPESAEDYQAVLRSMGMPEDATGYSAPEGIDSDAYSHVRDLAHKSNLTDKQFQTLVAGVAELDAAAVESQTLAQQESRAALQKEWGAAFDQHSSRAIAALEATGAPESVVELAKAGNIDGDTLKWFHALSEKIGGGEGSQAVADNGGNQVMTPAEATLQLQEVMSNPMYMGDTGTPEQIKAIRDKAMRLRKLRSGKS